MIIFDVFYWCFDKLGNMLNSVNCAIFRGQHAHSGCQVTSSTPHIERLFSLEKKLLEILKSISMHMRSRYGCAISQWLRRVHIWMRRRIIYPIDLLHGFGHILALNNALTNKLFNQLSLAMVHSKFNHYKT